MIKLKDILSVTELIGKSYMECGLTDDPGFDDVKVEGEFFGAPVEGGACFMPAPGQKTACLKSVGFSVKEGSFRDYYTQLTDRYSGPVNSGMTPFAIANGGAREWYIFDAGLTQIDISRGNVGKGVYVVISENPNPGYTGRLSIVTHKDGLKSPFEKMMKLKALSYENGILTVSITNCTGEPSTYSDSYILAKNTEGTGYSHMVKITQWRDENEPTMYEIADKETKELACDLRIFGKVNPGKYMLILDGRQLLFELAKEEY